ncbi:phage tail protein, partial [Shewanella algae]
AWVMEHDSDRDMLSPEEQQIRIDTNKVDDNKIDIDIDVMLCEAMHLIPDTQGPVLLDNRRWRLDVPPLYVAESIQVVTELETSDGK